MMSRDRLLFMSVSLLTVSLLTAGTMLATNDRADDGSDSLYKYLSVFSEVLSLVQRAYVDEQQENALLAGAFEGTFDALDPFSLYVPPGEEEAYQRIQAVGERHSGLLVLKERGVAYVVSVAEGSPASEAGLEPGQIVSQVQGQETRTIALFEVHKALAGSVGEEVEIEIIDQAQGGEKRKVRFTLAEFAPPGIELRQEKGIPVLRLPHFEPEALNDVKASLETLVETPDALGESLHPDKMVLDLRGISGGDEEIAYGVAGLFASGELGALSGREGSLKEFRGEQEPLWQGRIAVLIDNSTQGAAEVLAAVVKQRLEAELVGERSFGHSGEMNLISLSNGASLQMTTSFYSGPDGEPIKESLLPDLRVYPDFEAETDPSRDPVLEAALEKLLAPETEEEEELPEAA